MLHCLEKKRAAKKAAHEAKAGTLKGKVKMKIGGTNIFAEELICTISTCWNAMAGNSEEATCKATGEKAEME